MKNKNAYIVLCVVFTLCVGYLWIIIPIVELELIFIRNSTMTQPKPRNFPKALLCHNKGSWINNTYIPMSLNDNCTRMMYQFLTPTRPHKWLFLGDSILTRLFNEIAALSKTCKAQIIQKSKFRMEFINITRSSKWRKPTPLEGPIQPQVVPFGTECIECDCMRYKCNGNIELEFVAVEFARDVELQSSNTKTTQETLRLYLHNHIFDVCVVNVGMHDQQLQNLTDSQFISNAEWYLDTIKSGCRQILWLSLSKVRGDKNFLQRNERIVLWNRLVAKRFQHKSQDYAYLDLFPISNRTDLQFDNLHQNQWFYQYLARTIFIKPMFDI